MKKKLFTLLLCMFAVLGANAKANVTGPDENGLVVIENTTQGNFNLNNNDKRAIARATKLKLTGSETYTQNMLNLIKDALSENMTELDLSGALIASSAKLTGNLKLHLTKLTMPTDPSYTTIPAEFCNGISTLTEIVLSDNITEIGKNAFQGAGITSIDLPSNLQYIRAQAFEGTALEDITIPGSVKLIETEAFIDCDKLTKIVFEELKNDAGGSVVNMTIQEKAFRQADSVVDVYIETLGTINCNNNAFDFATTYGHGNTTAQLATLHFPASKAEDYANPKHSIDAQTASDPGLFHKWLMAHYSGAQVATNGWYEFVNNGATTPDEPTFEGDKFLKTYSDGLAHLVPQGVKAYIVNGYEEKDGNFSVNLHQIFAIPPFTGVILYGQTNSHDKDGNNTLTMTTVKYEGPILRRDHFDELTLDTYDKDGKPTGHTTYHKWLENRLLPTTTEDNVNNNNKVQVKPFDIDPITKQVTFRNFGMGYFEKTDSYKEYVKTHEKPGAFVGFFRLKAGSMAKGKAYLSLAADEYTNQTGMETIVVKDPDYRVEYDQNGNRSETLSNKFWTTADWDTDWGTRNLESSFHAKYMGEIQFFENEDGTATLILPGSMVEKEDNGDYYTLQGVKTSKPTAGVYIKNGKKVVIK